MAAVVPLREAIDLEPRPESAGAGRRFLRVTLTSWACPESTADQAVIVAAELLTNAILHAGTPLTMEVEYLEPVVRVSVRDYSSAPPILRTHQPDSITGRGLGVVAALSRDWGVEPYPDGKVVWAEVDGTANQPVNDDAEAPATPDLARLIRFPAMPIAAFLTMQKHHEAILRELELAALERMTDSWHSVAEWPNVVRLARQVVSTREGMRRAMEAAASRGERRSHIILRLRPSEIWDLRQWMGAMEEAEELCQSGQLLTTPADPDVVAVRRYLIEQLDARLLESATADSLDSEIDSLDTNEALRLTLEHAPIGMALVGLDGKWIRVNRALCEIVGYTEAELLTMTFSDITHPDDLDDDLAMANELATGQRRSVEFDKRYIHADGHVVPVHLSSALVRDSAGQPLHFISQVQDVSATRRVNDVQLSLALDAAAMGAFDLELSTNTMRWTDNFAQLLGLSPMVPPSTEALLQAVHPSDADAVRESLAQATRTGEPFEQEFKVHYADGSDRWMLGRVQVQTGSGGSAERLVGVVLDITERREAQESLREEQRVVQTLYARLYRRAQADQAGAERAAERLALLQAATARLSDVRAMADVSAVVLDELTRSVGADQSGLWALSRDGKSMELVGAINFPAELQARFASYPADSDTPAGEAFRTGRPVTLESGVERDRRFPAMAGLGNESQLSHTLPLQIEGRAIGVLSFSWRELPSLDDAHWRFIAAVGDQCAQALDRARLFEAERRAVRHQEFLAEASRALAASLDFDDTVDNVVRLVVPELADLCSLLVIESEQLLPVAHAAVDPVKEELLRTMSDRTDATDIHALLRVARTGEAVLNPVIDQEVLDAAALDDEHRRQMKILDIRSGMLVPLVARGNTVGLIALQITGDSDRRYSTDDVEVVLDLADRVAIALDNARTFQLRNEVAETLQHSLLPPDLPEIPGAELAARYEPALAGVDVGGDFYDAFDAGGDWALVMGDVCGKGAGAAALTAMVRYSLRAAAIQVRQPSAILTRLNESILRQSKDERFCTVAYARLVHTSRGIRVTVSSGGHPLPLIVRADGTVSRLGGPGGLLGVFPEIRLVEETTELSPGDALVLYTDGVTEAHRERDLFGEERLVEVLAGQGGQPAEVIADAVRDAVKDFASGPCRDDIALLVLRVPT